MPSLVKLNGIVDDAWRVVTAAEIAESGVPAQGPVLLPFGWWLEHEAEVADRAETGLWFNSDEEPEKLGERCQTFAVIAVNFPKFTDGRGYSIARLLRERYGYTGELRAIGDVLLDQLFYMKRCGFDAFALRPDKDINKAAAALQTFGEVYQAATDLSTPLFRRRG